MARKDPPYYDSQAAAAAALGVSVYDLRDAKGAGCRAFRSGRVYREEILAWFKDHPITQSKTVPSVRSATSDEEPIFIGAILDWEHRLQMIFAVNEFLDEAFSHGLITPAEYRRIGDKTIPLLVQLSKIWKAGIDEQGYLITWIRNRQGSEDPATLTCRQSAK
jgi:hypothetical protein